MNQSPESPEQPVEGCALNLTFASTDDLIAELKRRHHTCVVIHDSTDKQNEEEPGDDWKDEPEGCHYMHWSYGGSAYKALGMLTIARRLLLREFD